MYKVNIWKYRIADLGNQFNALNQWQHIVKFLLGTTKASYSGASHHNSNSRIHNLSFIGLGRSRAYQSSAPRLRSHWGTTYAKTAFISMITGVNTVFPMHEWGPARKITGIGWVIFFWQIKPFGLYLDKMNSKNVSPELCYWWDVSSPWLILH